MLNLCCGIWASRDVDHVDSRARGINSCGVWTQLPWGMWGSWFPHQGLTPNLLDWKADHQPLGHRKVPAQSELHMKVKALGAQSCPTLCNPMDCSPPGSSVHGILQARILEWGAIPFSRGSSQPGDQTQVSCIAGRLFTVQITRKAYPDIDFHIFFIFTSVFWTFIFQTLSTITYTCVEFVLWFIYIYIYMIFI